MSRGRSPTRTPMTGVVVSEREPPFTKFEQKLLQEGRLPVQRNSSTHQRLLALDVPIESFEKYTIRNALWAPAWAVVVSEADPCSDAAKDWAIEKALIDTEFRAALDTVVRLTPCRTAKERAAAATQMAALIIDAWEPPCP